MKRIYVYFFLLFVCPAAYCQSNTIFTDDFTGGSGKWSLEDNGINAWTVNGSYNCSPATPNNGGGNYMHVFSEFVDDCATAYYGGGSAGTLYAAMNADVTTVGYSTVTLTFDWLCQGQNQVFFTYGTLEYSTNSGGNWTRITSPVNNFNLHPNWTSYSLTSATLPALLNQPKIRFRFSWVSSGLGADPTFSIDNLLLTGDAGSVTCTNTGGTSSAIPSSICNNRTSVVSLTGQDGTIQWQQSANGTSGWANVTGGSGTATTTYTTATLVTTTYYRAVLSQASCADQFSNSALVTVNPAINTAGFALSATCNNSNGGVNLTVTGGSGNFTYLWSNGATTQNISNLPANTYVVTVTDGASCTGIASGLVIQKGSPSATATTTTATCGLANGSVNLTVSNGTPVYTYSWNNSATTQDLSNVLPDTYSATVTDANGCTAAASTVVKDSVTTATISISVSPNDTICTGVPVTFTATVTNQGNSPTYQWQRNGEAEGISSLTFSPPVFSNGDVIRCTLYSNACNDIENSNEITLTINTKPTVTLDLPPFACIGIPFALVGGSPDGGNYSGTGVTNNTFNTSQAAGPYTITYSYTNDKGCSDTANAGLILSACTGVDDYIVSEATVSPNPSEGIFFVTASETIKSIEVVNLQGQVMMREVKNNKAFSLDLSDKAKGVYFLKIETAKGTINKKLLIH